MEKYVCDNPSPDVVVVTRTRDLICQHFRRVRKECLKFASVEDSVLATKPTGDPTGEDIRAFSSVLYYKETKVICVENSSYLFQINSREP
jgi:hypothetical protein